MAKKKDKNDIFFVVSKSGNKKPSLHFYSKEKSVSKEKISIVYKNADTGRYITRPYVRDSRTGGFISVRHTQRHPNTTTTERIPKPGYGDRTSHSREHSANHIPKDSPIYFKKSKK